MKTRIVADSSCDLTALAGADFATVPLKIIAGDTEYADTDNLDTEEMLCAMQRLKFASRTSCPNPAEWLCAFGDAEQIFALTMTSSLSGSCSSARTAAREYTELHKDRRVHVIDTLSTGPETALIAERLRDILSEGADFDAACDEIARYSERTRLIFALESMENLVKAGRVSRLSAAAAGLLGIRAIGRASDVGTLEMIGKARGAASTVAFIVKRMLSEGFSGGRVRIHHVKNPTAAEHLAKELKRQSKGVEPIVCEARGLCSFYAERGGILVGFEV